MSKKLVVRNETLEDALRRFQTRVFHKNSDYQEVRKLAGNFMKKASVQIVEKSEAAENSNNGGIHTIDY